MRLGLGWRPELGASILAHLDRIDAVELLAEEYFDAPPSVRRALKFLATQVPVVVHGTSLGLASSEPVDRKRLDAMARLLGWLEPERWSEHLAFVRSGSIEIGHLAAPPRNEATLHGLMRNLDEARRSTGSLPLVENVASLVDPPCSTYGEKEWLVAVTRATGAELLLDLHNLHANATNFRFDPFDVLRALPRVPMIHLAGGRRIEGGRVLDDHLHAVPDAVYAMLAEVAHDGVTIVLERDGNYPPFDELLKELDRARDAARAPVHR